MLITCHCIPLDLNTSGTEPKRNLTDATRYDVDQLTVEGAPDVTMSSSEAATDEVTYLRGSS